MYGEQRKIERLRIMQALVHPRVGNEKELVSEYTRVIDQKYKSVGPDSD
jgi:hypothetical protein